MNSYILIRRLRGPVILLLIGTLALLHQMGVIPSFWRLMWPLLLITWGLLLLAERAAVEVEGYPPYTGSPWQCGGQGAGQSVYPGTTPGAAPQSAGQSTGQGAGQSEPPTGALVAPSLENDKMGGQS